MSESIKLGVILAIAGGFMDAYSYMCRGKVFANAQTGNILLLGINISERNWHMALHYLVPVLAFAIGIALADLVKIRTKNLTLLHWRQISVFCEAVILLSVSFIPQDFNLVAKALVENNPKHTLFVLEDLSGIRNVTERVKTKDRYISVSWSFYDLEQKLIYKAKQNQSSVIKVDPRYTSQCCPACGHTEKSNRNKKIHLFTCKNCGYKSNDDRIGAMNLYQIGRAHV